MFNPNAYSFHEGLYRTYGRVARVNGFFGVRPAGTGEDFWLPVRFHHTQCYYWEQDIQLVVSDPKACNNIIVKDQPIFEPTEAFLQYAIPLE